MSVSLTGHKLDEKFNVLIYSFVVEKNKRSSPDFHEGRK